MKRYTFSRKLSGIVEDEKNGDFTRYAEAAAIIAEKDKEIEALQNKVDALQAQLAEANRHRYYPLKS